MSNVVAKANVFSVVFIFSLALFFGCDGPRRDVVPQRYADFDSAIEAIGPGLSEDAMVLPILNGRAT